MEIIVNDVTLRDGLQNEPYFVETEKKVKLINLIIESGIKHLEITSFVNPKLLPQLKDNLELATHPELKNAYFSALVPNKKGFLKCVNTKIAEAVLFISACEKHNIKNLGKSIDESLNSLQEIFSIQLPRKINFRAAISMVFGSPFINNIPNDKTLLRIIEFFIKNNVSEITLSDTWGKASEKIIKKQLEKIFSAFNYKNYSVHLHNINGQGILNAEIALDSGIKKFDTSFKGLGGCPFSIEKGGNLNIRDLIKIAEKKGFSLKIDHSKILEIENFIMKLK